MISSEARASKKRIRISNMIKDIERKNPSIKYNLLGDSLENQIEFAGSAFIIVGEKWKAGRERPSKQQLQAIIDLLMSIKSKI